MLKEDYLKIIGCLDERISQCSKYLDKIVDSSSLENLSLAETRDLKKFCVEEVVKMTRACMVDLYHIIGMGNLTGGQLTQLISKFKKYVSYRPDIKKISTHLTSFDDIPKLPSKTRFKLLELGDVILESSLREGVNYDNVYVDEETVADYKSHSSFTINKEGTEITIEEKDMDKFLTDECKSIGVIGLSLDGIKKSIQASKDYGGGKWSYDKTNKSYTCKATAEHVKNNLKKLSME